MSLILCILAVAAIIFLFFIVCAFGLQAARDAVPTHQIPTTTYSYQMDRQHDDIMPCMVKATPADGNPQEQVWVMEANNGRAGRASGRR
ncbi:MAG TPA: hypothetical protein VMF64_04015 [Steroidobacteraceae bacterium]|nr:hypothetical protein [Steroidobacteraceae bacterium]